MADCHDDASLAEQTDREKTVQKEELKEPGVMYERGMVMRRRRRAPQDKHGGR